MSLLVSHRLITFLFSTYSNFFAMVRVFTHLRVKVLILKRISI